MLLKITPTTSDHVIKSGSMRLFIFTTDKDRSLPSLLFAAEKKNIKTTVIYYADLSLHEGKICWGKEPFRILKNDKILIRWPWDAKDTRKDYTFFSQHIVDMFYEHILLDRVSLLDFSPHYEDKLFQSHIFGNLGIKNPKVWYFSTTEQIQLPFPIVMKKRISSRSKQTFLITSQKELLKKIKRLSIQDILFQEYIPFEHDLRLLFYKDQFLGAVTRTPHVRHNNRLTVKGGSMFALNKKNLINDCFSYMKYIGADFVGFDVLLGKDGKYYVIEANLSPQYEKFEERTGVSVSEKIIEDSI